MKKGITIISAKYVEGYKIEITFSDGKVNIFDYKNLVLREHEETIPYREIENFKKFNIVGGKTEIAWGKNWDMILPLATIYNKTTVKEEKSPYNPKFVKKILKAEKRADYLEINPKNVSESLGIKNKSTKKKVKEEKSPYNPEFVKKILRSEKSKNRTEVKDVNDLWGSLGLKKKTPVKKPKK